MLNFKRNKSKVKADYSTNDLYDYYCSRSKNPISKKAYSSAIREYNTEVLRLIVFDGLDYSMHGRVGSFRIRKFDNSLRLNKDGEVANKLRPDWFKTKQKWLELYPEKTAEEIKAIPSKPIIYHLNEHSDGYVFKWYWDKTTSNIKNQTVYKFEPIRQMKRLAAKSWKEIPNLRTLYYE